MAEGVPLAQAGTVASSPPEDGSSGDEAALPHVGARGLSAASEGAAPSRTTGTCCAAHSDAPLGAPMRFTPGVAEAGHRTPRLPLRA